MAYNVKKIKGFTLVELIVVVAVLALLSTGVVLTIRGVQRNARISSNKAAAVQMVHGFNNYLAAGGDKDDIPDAGASTEAIWLAAIPSPLGDEGETIFTVTLPSPERFNQVRDWVIENADGVWIVDPDAPFDEVPK